VAVGTVNANRSYFEGGVRDMALAEARYPGWLGRLLTHPVRGLEGYAEMIRLLTEEKSAVKVLVEVARGSGDAHAALLGPGRDREPGGRPPV
jgi:hypothetical protein